MFKIEGLDKLQRELGDAQQALEALNGELGSVSFDPEDPGSINAAIVGVGQMVDERVGAFANNSIIRPIAEGLKERYRQAILDRAAAARLERGED